MQQTSDREIVEAGKSGVSARKDLILHYVSCYVTVSTCVEWAGVNVGVTCTSTCSSGRVNLGVTCTSTCSSGRVKIGVTCTFNCSSGIAQCQFVCVRVKLYGVRYID